MDLGFVVLGMNIGLHGFVLLRRRPCRVFAPPVVAGCWFYASAEADSVVDLVVRRLGAVAVARPAARSALPARLAADAASAASARIEAAATSSAEITRIRFLLFVACSNRTWPVGRREDRVVVAEPGAGAGQERLAALADDDRAGRDELAVAGLHAEPLADAVAAVLRAGTGFLVGHLGYSSFFARVVFLGAGFASRPSRSRRSCRCRRPSPWSGSSPGPSRRPARPWRSWRSPSPGSRASRRSSPSDCFASFAASAASAAACLAAASWRRSRSVFAAASALRLSSAALFLPRRTSVIRRTVSSGDGPS